jgi:hypothetical protein
MKFILGLIALALAGCAYFGEYRGYPGRSYYYYPRPYNGYYGGPIAPAYPPDDGGIPYPLPLHDNAPALHTEFNLY